jgi:hypothetical protein
MADELGVEVPDEAFAIITFEGECASLIAPSVRLLS